ncbi:MAG: response regulator [Armatimonadota bacterium]
MTSAPRILLVEDDPEQALLFGQVLRSFGYDVDTVTTAEEAQEHLEASPFDLLLADWQLPLMKGDALITLVKSQHPEIGTILFSNHTNVRQAAELAGADAWLRKFEGIDELRRLVHTVLTQDTGHDD